MASCRLRGSEREPERRRETRGRRKDGLEAIGELAKGADLRIPHMLVRDVDVDLAVARGVPSLLRGPEHGEVATGDADRGVARVQLLREAGIEGVGGRQLA